MIVDDFRSDTVTRPGEGMRAAMAAAEVGDAVYDDCPTTKRLEAITAERLGKDDFLAHQASPRGGTVEVSLRGGRVLLGGQAVTVLRGELDDDLLSAVVSRRTAAAAG